MLFLPLFSPDLNPIELAYSGSVHGRGVISAPSTVKSQVAIEVYEVLGVARRRRWDDDEKLAMVSAVSMGGATVTQGAQRHDVTRQQIYAWRHELKRKRLWSPDAGALFLPVGAPSISDLPAVTAPAPAIGIELRLAKGRMLRFESDIDDASTAT